MLPLSFERGLYEITRKYYQGIVCYGWLRAA